MSHAAWESAHPPLSRRVNSARGTSVRRQHRRSGNRRGDCLLKALAIPSQLASRGAAELQSTTMISSGATGTFYHGRTRFSRRVVHSSQFFIA